MTATSDSKPAIMPRSQSGLVGTGVAAGAGSGVIGGLDVDGALVPAAFVAVTEHL